MNQRIASDTAYITISRIIALVVSLASSMLLSRFRTLDEYGTYSQLLILASLASAVFSLGLPSSTNYFLARADAPEERRRFLSVFYLLCTIISVIMGAVLVLTIHLSSAYFNNQSIEKFGFFLAVFPWTSIIISSISNVLVVYGKVKKLLIINVVNSFISLISIIIVQIMGWSFREYLILYLCGECGITLWIYVLIVFKLEGKLSCTIDWTLVMTILKYSVPIGLAGLVSTMCIEIDKLMIGRFFDTESLAIYSVAATELPLTIVASSFTAVLLPQMARRLKENDIEGTVELWGYSIQLSYIIICFFTMACIVFAPQIISVLYSNKYQPGVSVFRVYSLVMLLRVTYFGIVLNSLGKTRLIFFCSLASLALNVMLNYLMYLVMGFVGPSIATFLSIGLVGLIQLILTSRVLNIKFSNVFPWRNIAIISGFNLMFGICLYIIVILFGFGTDENGCLMSIALGVVAMTGYASCMKSRLLTLWRNLNGKK